MAFGNIDSPSLHPDNPLMDLRQLFLEFFGTVGLGSATVFVLFGVVRLRTPRRSAVLIPHKPSR